MRAYNQCRGLTFAGSFYRYCENGSLHAICKRFGKFPENLVAVYISQVYPLSREPVSLCAG